MKYSQFILYNVVGAALWVALATLAGFFFGNIEFVRKNFSMVIIGVVLISVLPIVVEMVLRKFRKAGK